MRLVHGGLVGVLHTLLHLIGGLLYGFVFTRCLTCIGFDLGAPTGHQLGRLSAIDFGEEGHVVRWRLAVQEGLVVRVGDGEEDDGAIHLAGVTVAGVDHAVVLEHLLQVVETADDKHAEAARFVGREVEALDLKVREVVGRHGVEQGVGFDGAFGVEQHHAMQRLGFVDEGAGGVRGRDVAKLIRTEAQIPLHARQATLHQRPSTQHTLQHLAGQLRHIGRGILRHERLQRRLERRHVAGLHIGERLDKHELRHQRGQRIGAAELTIAAAHERRVALEVTVVRLLINRILHTVHHTDMVLIVRIGDGGGIVALGEGLHEAIARAGLERLVLVPKTHEVRLEVVIHPVLIVREAPLQLLECLDRERLVLQLILVDHAHVVQPIGDDDVRCLHVLRREGDLLQVILARLGVGRDGVLQRVTDRIRRGDRVAVGVELRRVGQVAVGVVGGRSQRHGLVAATPIVLIDALAPLVLELGLALRHGLLVVEIEAAIVPVEQRHLRRLYVLPLALEVVATALLVGQVTLLVGLFGLPFLFLLHLRDDLIDHGQPLLFGHAR